MARWLQYWLIFALLSLLDSVIDGIGAYLPFYYEIKVGFMLWLTLDKFKGATLICTKYVEPFLSDKTGAIDAQIDFVSAKAKNLKADDLRTFVTWVQSKDFSKALET